jgi:hypothetical protein
VLTIRRGNQEIGTIQGYVASLTMGAQKAIWLAGRGCVAEDIDLACGVNGQRLRRHLKCPRKVNPMDTQPSSRHPLLTLLIEHPLVGRRLELRGGEANLFPLAASSLEPPGQVGLKYTPEPACRRNDLEYGVALPGGPSEASGAR